MTETDDVAAVLDDAQARCPGASRHDLLVQLVFEGDKAVKVNAQARTARRLEALRRHRGAASGLYGPDYLKHLRDEWPEPA